MIKVSDQDIYANLSLSSLKSSLNNLNVNLVYGSLANTPYQSTFGKFFQNTASREFSPVKELAKDLKTATDNLIGIEGRSALNAKSLVSSQPSSVSGTPDSNAAPGSYNIRVMQLATTQTNQGTSLPANNATAFDEGWNTFELKTASGQKTLSFQVVTGETNQQSLEKMAKAINNARAGVTASVMTDTEKGTSSLRLTANETGENRGFTLADTPGGSAVGISGSNTVEKAGTDAKYTVDGTEYLSRSNTVSLPNDSATLTLNSVETTGVTVTIARNASNVVSKVQTFIDTYNQLVNEALKSNQSSTNLAQKTMDNTYNRYRDGLEKIGINKNTDGSLSIDTNKFENAVKNDFNTVYKVLNPANGYLRKVNDLAGNMMNSPYNYTQSLQLEKVGIRGMYLDMFI